MILTMVMCDMCGEREAIGDDVPDSWVRFDGKHYCTPNCFAQYRGGIE
jgi:hypothetical protein